MTIWRRLRIAHGIGALAVLFAIAFAPDLVGALLTIEIADTVRDLAGPFAALSLGFVVLLWLLNPVSSTVQPLVSEPPEEIHGRQTPRAGASFDEAVATALHGDDGAAGAQTTVNERLRTTAVGLYAVTSGCSQGEAIAAVERGTWTDDPRAAAYLGEDPTVPLRLRVWDFLRPGNTRRHQITHTLAALERLDNRTDGEAEDV